MSTRKERRQSRRVTTEIDLELAGLDRTSVAARTLNLSAGGAYMVVERRFEPLSKLELAIELPPLGGEDAATEASPLLVEAVVVHSEPAPDIPGGYRVGVAFMNVSPSTQRRLEDYIEWRLTRSLLESADGARAR